MSAIDGTWMRQKWGLLVAMGLALATRVLVLWWAGGRFPPAADGRFYNTVAERIAQGRGYTWLWPDGAVTFAAHYPVGYPAMLGALYAILGSHPIVAMALNAVLGVSAVLAVYLLIERPYGPRAAGLSAAAAALHPALVLYTPAIMTEGVVASLLIMGCLFCQRFARHGQWRQLLPACFFLGAASLVRPQSVLMVPPCAIWVGLSRVKELGSVKATLQATVLALGVLGVCLPWTLRNCHRMDRCVFVSANAGWNLLIGTHDEGRGAWVALSQVGVPPACRTVFEEAAKDACFLQAGRARISSDPLGWLSLVPKKLGATFDYPSAAAAYLAEANPSAVSAPLSALIGGVELVTFRLLMLLALIHVATTRGSHGNLRLVLCCVGSCSLFLPWGAVSVFALLVGGALIGRGLLDHFPLLCVLSVLALTALVHSVFFGAGRYALVAGYFMAALIGPAVCALPALFRRLKSGVVLRS